MAKYSIDGSTLTDIANAIRTQYGEDSPIAVTDMAEAILGIEGGGGGEFNEYDIASGTFTLQNSQIVIADRRTDSGEEPYYNPYVVEHGMGKIPVYILVMAVSGMPNTPSARVHMLTFATETVTRYGSTGAHSLYSGVVFRINGSSNSTSRQTNIYSTSNFELNERNRHVISADENEFRLGDVKGLTTANSQYTLGGGVTYSWIALFEKD